MQEINAHCSVSIDPRGVARMTIRNAGSLTIFGSAVIEAVRGALATLADNPDIRVLILQGGTEKAFVGGADLKELVTLDPESAVTFITGLRDACEAVRHFPCPVIARIPGWCIGGGLEFAVACDFRVASDTSHYSMPEVKVGIPSVIHAAMLPRLIGISRTRWLVMTAQAIDAATALDWGLVDVVAPPDALDAEVETLVAMLLDCGPRALAAQKVLLRQWEELSLTEAVNATIPVFGASFLTDEPRRYMRPFLDRKRDASH